jgi:uncharacterized protein (DUF2267 family)
MNSNHLPVLEHTIQKTNVWLKKLEEEHHLRDRHQAHSALRSVLHALRDRLTPEQAVHFAAQLPILVRGIYYKGWHLAAKPTPARHLDDFLARVAAGLPPQFPRDAPSVTKAVFDLLWRELDPGETAKVIASLPAALRPLWPEAARG